MAVSTIHIFGYGETQIIGEGVNKKVETSSLSTAQAVIDNVYSTKPSDNNSGTSYFAINIYVDLFSDYIPKTQGEDSFRTPYAELDSTLIDALISEVEAQ